MLVVRVDSDVPGGIWSFKFWQACCAEMKETPTREVTEASLKVKTAPKRADGDSRLPSSEYFFSSLDGGSPPRNVLKVAGESNEPQK